jgi:hypothetical protein
MKAILSRTTPKVFQSLLKASIQTQAKDKLRVGLCQILVKKEKEYNIRHAAKLIDSVESPDLVVR